MKKAFIILSLLCLLTGFARAQSAIAKIKYELAEEAFNKGDYETTIAELDGAEKLLGVTNPKILYLRIMALKETVAKNPYASFSNIQLLRDAVSGYIKNYQNVDGIEEKFREVYTLSEKLDKYPKTQQEFDNAVAARQAAKDDRAKLVNAENFKNFDMRPYPFGVTKEQLAASFPQLFENTNHFKYLNNGIMYSKNFFKVPLQKDDIYIIIFSNGVVTEYWKCLYTDKGSTFEELKKIGLNATDQLNKYFGFEASNPVNNPAGLDMHSWKNDDKEVSIFVQGGNPNAIFLKVAITPHP